MVPPARKRWNPIQRGSVAKIEVSPQPECVLIKSRGKGERLSIPRELFATFRFFKRPSNRGGGIGKGGKKKRKKGKKERNIAMETRINEYPLRLTRRGIVFCLRRGFPRSPAVPADITILEYVCYKENETTNGRPVLQSDTFARGRPCLGCKE